MGCPSPQSCVLPVSMPIQLLAALVFGAIVVAPVHAQEPPLPVPPPPPDTVITMICKKACDVVSGTVYDSLADQALGEAFVVAMPTGVSATADSLGRFVIASDGLVEQLTVYHSVLDQLGLGALTAARPATGDTWKGFRVATPSLPTLWRRLCSTPSPTRLRGVIVAGTVRLADNVTRVSGAKVIAQWKDEGTGGSDGEFGTAEATSDSTGSFVICGVADFREPSLVALAAEVQSGVVTLPADSRPLRRMDLVMAQPGATPTTVRGRIVNEWNAPLPAVRVSIEGRDGEMITDASGVFRLVDVPLGSRMLSVRALGFPPHMQVVHVTEGEMEPLTVPITRTYTLGRIELTPADTVRRERREFEQRRRTGIGYLIDSTMLKRGRDLRSVLRSVPGLTVTDPPARARLPQSAATRSTSPDMPSASSRIEFIVRASAPCQLNVFLDGIFDQNNAALFTRKDEFAAVEVFLRASDIPDGIISTTGVRAASFPMLHRCGALFFWSHFGLRP